MQRGGGLRQGGHGGRGSSRREEKIASLREHLAAYPWDTSGWESLTQELQARTNPDNIVEKRNLYEDLLARFPTSAHHWRAYAEAEMAVGNWDAARAVFGRCLLNCLDLELWHSYTRFIRKVNEPKGPDGVDEVRKAYEYTLDKVGQDLAAGSLWADYIHFLQGPKPGTPAYTALYASAAGQEDAHRVATIRRVFQRAVMVPCQTLDQLWRSYEQFESSSTANKTLARRLIDEARPRYQAARAVVHMRRTKWEAIDHQALPVPPEHSRQEAVENAAAWRDYLAFERSNPARLSQQDMPLLSVRVSLAYDQALMFMYHHPEMWYEYALWHTEGGGGGPPAALAVLSRACKAVPQCLALHLSAADLEEASGTIERAVDIYESLVTGAEGQAVPDAAAAVPRVALPPDLRSLAWIQYQRFSRRAQGVQESRKVFMRARRQEGCSWQVYIASALMEWAGERSDKVARNILELGIKNLGYQPDYVLQYITFLKGIGDVENARALFERALMGIAADSTAAGGGLQPLWDAYVAFEYENGDLSSVQAVERRRSEALAGCLTTNDQISLLLDKYRYLDLVPCSVEQSAHFQRLLGRQPASQQSGAGPRGEAGGRSPRSQPASSPVRGAAGNWQQQQQPIDIMKQMPAALGNFINSLPPPQMYDGPPTDVDLVMSALMAWDGVAAAEPAALGGPMAQAPGAAGTKRKGAEDGHEEGRGAYPGAQPFDVFRARRKRAGRMGGPEA